MKKIIATLLMVFVFVMTLSSCGKKYCDVYLNYDAYGNVKKFEFFSNGTYHDELGMPYKWGKKGKYIWIYSEDNLWLKQGKNIVKWNKETDSPASYMIYIGTIYEK